MVDVRDRISPYREKHQEEVTVPSGCEFRIKRLSPITVNRIKGSRDLDEFSQDIEAIGKILVAAVVDPRLTIESVGDENTLSIEELDMEDLTDLLNKVIEYSGLSKTDEGEEEVDEIPLPKAKSPK